MGGILLDAKTDRHGPQGTPTLPTPPTCILCVQEGSHYQPYNDTIHCVRAPAIPFGFHQSRAAVDGDLIGRVNQELMSERLKCPCWTQKSPLVKVSIREWMGQSARLGRDWISNHIPDVTKRRAGSDLQC